MLNVILSLGARCEFDLVILLAGSFATMMFAGFLSPFYPIFISFSNLFYLFFLLLEDKG